MNKANEMMTKIQPVLDKYELTREEKELLNKAKNQVRQHVFFAAVGGSFGGVLVALRKKPVNFLRIGMMSTAFAFVGTQIGFLTGYNSAMKTIKSMPDQQKLKNIFKEVVEIFQNERQKRGLPILQPPDYKARVDRNGTSVGTENKSETKENGNAWDTIREKTLGQNNNDGSVNQEFNDFKMNDTMIKRNKYGDIIELDDEIVNEMKKE
ncbi:hypothetical protein K502DRAFT_96094 [Neoconidiobolus thromboides FSU 785]|nr:hypothetical protein K502DRAFT_96094 [Neoconidiobolus thromboides FSU 785]